MEDRFVSVRRPRPLEIPCVLQHVLQFLPYADLKNTRLVSKTFNDEATRMFRKKSKIVLNSSKRLIAYELEKFPNVDKFCDGFQLINLPVATPTMKTFCQNLGPRIKYLDLRDAKCSCEELQVILMENMTILEEFVIHGPIPKGASGRLFPPLSVPKEQQQLNNQGHWSQVPSTSKNTLEETPLTIQYLPKIKILDLQLYDKEKEEDFLQQILSDLLSASYNLEILRSRDTGKWKNRRERFHRILFELLINPEVEVKLNKLRRIDFRVTPWSDDQMQGLIEKHFPLSYLNLTILPAISIKSLIALLISLRNSLTKLKLSFAYWRLTELPCDMNLHKLHHLSLDWFNGSIAFVTHLKSLQTLILAQSDLNEIFTESEVAKFIKPNKLLSKFEVYQHSGAVLLPRTVQLISKVFPAVKKLVLGKLNDESLRAVFSEFPLIEEFSAIEGAYTDYGVTGIPPDSCTVCHKNHLPELTSNKKGLITQAGYNEQLVDGKRVHLYIADLKCLRKLEMKSPYLSNITVIHGIAHCQSLRSLSLWCYQLTFRSLQRLLDSLNLDYLESTHTFTDESEIRYARRKMRGRTLILNGLEAPKACSHTSSEAFVRQFYDSLLCRNLINSSFKPPSKTRQHVVLTLTR